MDVKFKRIVTGFRCHEADCIEEGVWYVETGSEFFHWCGKHAIAYMGNREFWIDRVRGPDPSSGAGKVPRVNRKRRSPARGTRSG